MSGAVHVLAVHGNGGGGERFGRLIRRMPPGIVLDPVTLPGFGGRPADPAVQTMEEHGALLVREIEALPRPRVALGHGIGGSLLLAALQQPVALDGLILHAPVGASLDTRALPRLMRVPGATAATRRAIAARPLRPLLRRRLFDPTVPREVTDTFFDGYAGCASFDLMFRIITPEWFASLRPVDVPAEIVWGERDGVLDPRQAAAFRRIVPGARERIVPGWGHFPMIDEPDAYVALVSAIVGRLVPAAAPGPRR